MTQPLVIGWAGSSNTASGGYRVLTQNGLIQELIFAPYTFSFLNISAVNYTTFPNLVNFADLSTADLIIFDQSNDGTDATQEVEALLRLAQAAGQRVIGIVNPVWSSVADDQVNTPANQTAMEQHMALLTAYGVPYVNGWQMSIDHVVGGGHLSDYFSDVKHWASAGHTAVEAELDDLLPLQGTVVLPVARVYAASADFEQTPVIRNGADHDGVTGTWTVAGTSISSSEADATITFIGTFRKFGCYRADATYPAVSVSIDGGAFAVVAFRENGYDIGTRAEHTVIVKVATTCKVDKFWAI